MSLWEFLSRICAYPQIRNTVTKSVKRKMWIKSSRTNYILMTTLKFQCFCSKRERQDWSWKGPLISTHVKITEAIIHLVRSQDRVQASQPLHQYSATIHKITRIPATHFHWQQHFPKHQWVQPSITVNVLRLSINISSEIKIIPLNMWPMAYCYKCDCNNWKLS